MSSLNNPQQIIENETTFSVRCQECSGWGLVKVDKVFECNNCKQYTFFCCYLCENVPRGRFEECTKCHGTGSHLIKNEKL